MTLNFFQEFFSVRNDASLFIFGSHSKKRPHNLVLGMCFHSLEHLTLISWRTSCYKSKITSHICSLIGRCFDGHILDMIELGIDKFVSIKKIKVRLSLNIIIILIMRKIVILF